MRLPLVLLALVGVSAYADVAPFPRPPRPPPPPPGPVLPSPPPDQACRVDGDCVVSMSGGCCGECCRVPIAQSRAGAEAEQNRCAIVDCAALRCDGIGCGKTRPASDFIAVCSGGACALEDRPRGLDVCQSTADCVLSDFQCCGGCCGGRERAMTRARLAEAQQVCARKDCAARDCSTVRCAAPVRTPQVAECHESRCVAVPVGVMPPANECSSDAECRITYPGPGPGAACRTSPCGCCPGTEPVAVSVRNGVVPLIDSPAPPPRQPAPSAPSSTPPLGLSEGPTVRGPTMPACSPCPGPRPASAACRAGRCVVTPPSLPRR